MWTSRPAKYAMLIAWIFIYFNGLMITQDTLMVMAITTVADVVPATVSGTSATNNELTTIIWEQVTSLPTKKTSDEPIIVSQQVTLLSTDKTSTDDKRITTKSGRTIESSSSSAVSPQRIDEPTYVPVGTTQQVLASTSPSSVPSSDSNIYILIGAACTGFLALVLFIILLIFICKRCRRNDYTKAHSDPQYDDEKGDISGPRWVFNDSRQDWLYDGADDEDDNQYVGPLPGKTGKRTSLMDKRYNQDGETFGRASPSEARKRPPIVVSGSIGTLEGLTFGEEAEDNENTTAIAETNIDEKKIDIDSSGGVDDEKRTDDDVGALSDNIKH